MTLSFEWDPQKARSNRVKHKVTFEEAASVFRDRNQLNMYDAKHSTSEDRWLTMGLSSRGRLLVVSHTYQEESETKTRIRIISSRQATSNEASNYGS